MNIKYMEFVHKNGSAPLEKRFLDRLIKKRGCWDWNGTKSQRGYGTIIQEGKAIRAHRLSYEFYIGKIPTGTHVLHKCDNPSCCNPKHLFVGTHEDNMRDRTIKGRGAMKLDWNKVRAIRTSYKNRNGAILAKKFGVSESTIYEILRNEIWKI